MPRITPDGQYAYAAKDEDGRVVSVQPTSPEATRFSVLGALLREFHERNVTQTATGRQELLGEELLDALRQVVGDEASEQEVAPGDLPSSGKQVPPVSHAQCLETLDVLEARYTGGMEQSAAAAQATADDLRLPDLLERLERQRPVTMDELCVAMSNELKAVHERLDALERPPGKG